MLDSIINYLGSSRSKRFKKDYEKAKDDEAKKAVLKQYLEEKSDEIKDSAESNYEKSIKLKLKKKGIDENESIDEMIDSISQKTLTKEEIKKLPEFKDILNDSVSDLKTENENYKKKIEDLETTKKKENILSRLSKIADKALEGKRVKSERQRKRFINDLFSLADDFDVVDDKLIPLDSEGNAVKDKLHNVLNIEAEATKLADEDFDDSKEGKKKLGDAGGSQSETFNVPDFEGSESEIKQKKSDWYDSLDEDSKKKYQDYLEAQTDD